MKDYSGMEVEVVKDIRQRTHWHLEIEVVFVIEGEVKAVVRDKEYILKKEDVLLVDSGLTHRLDCKENTLLCIVKYPCTMLTKAMGNNGNILVCNSVKNRSESYHELRNIFHRLVHQYIKETHQTDYLKESLLLQLLDCLIENYQLEISQASAGKVSDDVRMQQIMQFISQNFQQNISLSGLAEQLFISPSTLSRIFKKQTGIYFVDYVNQVRVRFAMSELMHSDNSITKIAADSGFSNLSVFNRVFKDVYKMTPSDLRKQKQAEKEKKHEENEKLREDLRHQLQEKELRLPVEDKQFVSVKVDGNSGKLYHKSWNKAINIGFMNQLLLSNLQEHTLYLVKNLGFQYVRLWNVFSQQLMITDGKQIGRYNYHHLDTILDFLVANQIYPFMDFGIHPNTAIRSFGNTVFFEYDYIRFQSKRAWEAMLHDFIAHVIERYGADEVSNWIFELSCDRRHIDNNSLYQDKDHPFDFCEAFDFFFHEIKKYLPEAQVGGPSFIVDWDIPFQKRFFTQCMERQCVPDFISFMVYPYTMKDHGDNVIAVRTESQNAELEMIRSMKTRIERMGLTQCKLYISEWSNSLSNRNYFNDSCFRGAYMARMLAEIWDSVDMICLRMGSDLVGSYYDTTQVADGNLGLLTRTGIRKPAYFTAYGMNHLGDHCIARDRNYIITRTNRKSFYIVCFNMKNYSCDYFLKEEFDIRPGEISDFYENHDPVEIDIVLDQLPDDMEYIMKRRMILDGEGSLLYEWSRFQYERELESMDFKYLHDACFPRMLMQRMRAEKGKLHISVKLQPNEVDFLHIFSKAK